MSKKNKNQEPTMHHLGTPDFIETFYHSANCEYSIVMQANATNTHFLGKDVKFGDELYLGLSEESFESLLDSMIGAISDRLKDKLERYNDYNKLYYKRELHGTEESFQKSNWNRLKK